MRSMQSARSPLLRLLDAQRQCGRPREHPGAARQALAMLCLRCRQPMQCRGSSVEERLEDGEPTLVQRWRCSRCGTGARLRRHDLAAPA